MVADQHRALDPRAVHQDADVGVDRVLAVKEGVHLNAMVMKMLFLISETHLAHFFNDTFPLAVVLIDSTDDTDKVTGVNLTRKLDAAQAFALT